MRFDRKSGDFYQQQKIICDKNFKFYQKSPHRIASES